MSTTTAEPALGLEIDELPPEGTQRPGYARLWWRVGLACAILAASGATRLWQERRIEAGLRAGRAEHFPLKNLPAKFPIDPAHPEAGSWREVDEETLSPEIVRGSGSTDSLHRTYVDERTGVHLGVLVLYGTPVEMQGHAPQVCYPMSGHVLTEGPMARTIKLNPGKDSAAAEVPFLAMVFVKGNTARAERKQVYYTWRYNDRWTPTVLSPKAFQRTSGMYKVHIERHVAAGEALGIDNNPTESFLSVLLPEIERQIALSRKSSPAAR